jgi:branched-chain amino acid transport system permease protein
VPWWEGLLIGAVVAAAFALGLSFAVFRLSGMYFSIGTLVVPEALRIVFYLWRPVGGSMHGAGAGYMVKGTEGLSTDCIYWIALAVAVAAIAVVRVLLRSRLGLALAAVRDNPRAAASSGVNVFRLKLAVFIVSAAVTGLAGGVYYLNQGYVEPTATFNARWTMILLLATVIGGIRSEEGPVIGSAFFVFLYFALARYGGYSLLIQGVVLILVMVLSPRGVVGLLRKVPWYRRLTGCNPREGCVAVEASPCERG